MKGGLRDEGAVMAMIQRLRERPKPTYQRVRLQSLRAVICGALDLPKHEVEPRSRDSDGQGRITIDEDAWLLWMEAGLVLFSDAVVGDEGESKRTDDRARCMALVPTIRAVVGESNRVALALAMLRHGGNLTHAAKALGMSRRALRERLKAAGLYPWDALESDRDEPVDLGSREREPEPQS